MTCQHLRLPLALALSLLASTLARAQADSSHAQPGAFDGSLISARATADPSGDVKGGGDDKKKSDPPADPAKPPAAEPGASVADPLVRVLMAKGLLTTEEGRAVSAAATPAEQRDRLATLLRDKGLISPAEYEAVRAVAPAAVAATSPTAERAAETSASLKPNAAPPAQNPSAAPAPAVIAAIAPTRLLQVDPPKREGLIPDLKLGTGARVKFYGIFKTSIIHDSSSPQGNDFPLPLLAADTGPNNSPEFHLRARGPAARRQLRVARPGAEDDHHRPLRVRLRGRLHACQQPQHLFNSLKPALHPARVGANRPEAYGEHDGLRALRTGLDAVRLFDHAEHD